MNANVIILIYYVTNIIYKKILIHSIENYASYYCGGTYMFSVHVSNPLKGDNSKKQLVRHKGHPNSTCRFPMHICAETPTSFGTKIGSICCMGLHARDVCSHCSLHLENCVNRMNNMGHTHETSLILYNEFNTISWLNFLTYLLLFDIEM